MKRRRDKALECNSFGQDYRTDGTIASRSYRRRYTELFTDRKGVTRERVRTDETRHTFAGSFESVSGRGWIYHFDGGYVTMTDGEAHYFARDYQGSTRAVYTATLHQMAPLAASADGAEATASAQDVSVTPRPQYTLEQVTDYYPTGLPVDITAEMTDAPSASASTDRLHIGNRWINHAGLGYYDNTARYFDALTVRFTAADRLEWKTPQLSPWSHCAGNPVNLIDPSGMFVIADNWSQQGIIEGLSREEANLIQFNEAGELSFDENIDLDAYSENFKCLITLAKSDRNYIVTGVTEANISGDQREFSMKKGELIGYTLMPGVEGSMSPDDNVYVYTSLLVNPIKRATNVAHELYGHAYFFEKGKNPVHQQATYEYQVSFVEELQTNEIIGVFKAANTELENHIKRVEKIANDNYFIRLIGL